MRVPFLIISSLEMSWRGLEAKEVRFIVKTKARRSEKDKIFFIIKTFLSDRIY